MFQGNQSWRVGSLLSLKVGIKIGKVKIMALWWNVWKCDKWVTCSGSMIANHLSMALVEDVGLRIIQSKTIIWTSCVEYWIYVFYFMAWILARAYWNRGHLGLGWWQDKNLLLFVMGSSIHYWFFTWSRSVN